MRRSRWGRVSGRAVQAVVSTADACVQVQCEAEDESREGGKVQFDVETMRSEPAPGKGLGPWALGLLAWLRMPCAGKQPCGRNLRHVLFGGSGPGRLPVLRLRLPAML